MEGEQYEGRKSGGSPATGECTLGGDSAPLSPHLVIQTTNLQIKIPKDDVLLKQEKQKRVSTLAEIEAPYSISKPDAEEQLLMLRYRSAAGAAKPWSPEVAAVPNGLLAEGNSDAADGERAGLTFAAARRQWLLIERQASQTELSPPAPLSPRRVATGDRDASGGGSSSNSRPLHSWSASRGLPTCNAKSSPLHDNNKDEVDDDSDSGYRFPDSPDDAPLTDSGSLDLGLEAGGGTSMVDSAMSADSLQSPHEPDGAAPATPIEQEIQQSLRREESLRRRRGMNGIACGGRGSTELVEIKTLPALSRLTHPRSPLPLNALYANPGKFRLAEQQMYRDIRLETQREEVLVRAGHVRGQYDRGAAQELGLLKKIFEQPEPPLSPTTPKAHGAPASAGPVRQSSRERLLLEPASENVVIVEHKVLQPQARMGAPLTSTPQSAARSLEWDTGNVIILESRMEIRDEGPMLREPPEPPLSPPGGGPLSPFGSSLRRASNTLSLIEREIHEAHRRDDELKRQRQGVYGNAGKPEASPEHGSLLNAATGDRTRQALGGGAPAMSSSSSPTSPMSHAAEVEPITNGQGNQHPAHHRDPSPGSKSGTAQVSPGGSRSPRKSALALRWEAGIFANHQESMD